MTSLRSLLALLLLAVVVAPATGSAAAGADEARPYGDIRLFAHVPTPGHPNSSVVGRDGSVYVSSNRGPDTGPLGRHPALRSQEPSKVFRYNADGKLLRSYTITGQDLESDHGLMGMAFDAQDRLYVVDYAPARILRLDLVTGEQETYATLPRLDSCPERACQPWPVVIIFDEVGNLYISDLTQGAIFRVPPGGGEASPWLRDPRWTSPFGVSGLQFDHDGTLIAGVTGSAGLADSEQTAITRGAVYRIPLNPDRTPGVPQMIYTTAPGEGPDQLTVGRSGRIYLCTLITNSVIVISGQGQELRRITGEGDDVPLDSPSSATFHGNRLLVTNLTFVSNNPKHDAVLDIAVHDTEGPRHIPAIP